jgi:integrase
LQEGFFMKARFTDKMLRGLKADPTKSVDYWDELLPGFGVRVGTTGRKSFFVGTRINGKYRRITLKPPYDLLSLADARTKAKAIMTDAHGGIGPELRKKREEKGTFGAVAAAFMQDYAKDHRTRGEYQRKIDVDLADWHDRQITDIKRADIKDLIRVKARTAPVAANRLLSVISKIFNWAVKEEIIESSQATQLDRPGKETERERSLSAEEIKNVWGVFDGLGYPWGPLYKMLLVTGQRRGEVAGMRWSEINGEGWKLPGERAKKGKGHLVPLSSLAREILDGAPQIGELVFRSNRDAPVQNWSKAAKRLRKLCGPMEPWHLHDLRRSFATHLRSLGVERLVVSKLLNHTEGGTTKIYDRYGADPEKSAAMERWANRLREIISGAPASNVVRMTPKSA